MSGSNPWKEDQKIVPPGFTALFDALQVLSDTFPRDGRQGDFMLTVATGELRRVGDAHEERILRKDPILPSKQLVRHVRPLPAR